MNKLFTILFVLLLSVTMLNAQDKFEASKTNKSFDQSTSNTEDATIYFYGDSGALYTATAGGYAVGVNGYGELGKYQRFDTDGPGLLFNARVRFAVKEVIGTADTMKLVVYQATGTGQTDAPGELLYSTTFTTDDADTTDWTQFAIPNLAVPQHFFIGVEWEPTIDDTVGIVSDQNGQGDDAHRSWCKGPDSSYYSFSTGWGGLNFDLWFVAEVDVFDIISIAEAKKDLDGDLVPDRLGDTVVVAAMVISPNYQTANHSYYIADSTAGITTFMAGTTEPALNLGDIGLVRGKISQYKGLTQLQPFGPESFIPISTGNEVPAPPVITLANFLANAEQYESTLVGIMNLSLADGTWPAEGSSATIKLTDGSDTVAVRIDNDTDIDGNPEPTWPVDLIALGSQFDFNEPYDGGYQLMPRYITDFMPAGSLPVELTSFTASVSANAVVLNWATATETNNQGFEVERKESGSSWNSVGFVNGYGTTTESKTYSFTDSKVNQSADYSYRLKQVDFDGTFSYSNVVEVTVGTPTEFALEQNYPNPFNPTTNIKFSLPEASNVKVTVFNTIGQEVTKVVNKAFEAGVHNVEFNAANLNSGVYLYRIEAGNFVQIKKMMLLK